SIKPSDNTYLSIFSINRVPSENRLSHTDTIKSLPFMLKICVGAFFEPSKCLCDLLPYLTRGHKIPKTVYYIGYNLGRSGGRTRLGFSFSQLLYHVSWVVVEVTMLD
ncbi:hypothetical protein KSS87_004531, partial [Heliosperma pusillum]